MRTRTSYKEIKRRRMLKNVCGCVRQEIVLGGPPCVAAIIIAAGFEEAQVLPRPLRFGHVRPRTRRLSSISLEFASLTWTIRLGSRLRSYLSPPEGTLYKRQSPQPFLEFVAIKFTPNIPSPPLNDLRLGTTSKKPNAGKETRYQENEVKRHELFGTRNTIE
ncbi:hypothetical protein U1Q18_041438 [Sarracenia purpurea var. burkii]